MAEWISDHREDNAYSQFNVKDSQVSATLKMGVINPSANNTHTPGSASDEIINAYDKYGLGKNKNKNGNTLSINQKGHKKTYIFLLDFNITGLNGRAPPDYSTGQFAWGNAAIVLKSGLDDYKTLVHEIAHSMGLPHIFEPNFINQYKFHQGFSDKVMDYTWQLGTGNNNPKSRISFARYQWYLMQKDPSVYELQEVYMKMRKLVLTLVIATSLVACDTNSSDSLTFDSGKAVKSSAKLDKKNSINSVSSSDTEPKLQQNINTIDWAPLITKTPAKQAHEPFFLPKENVRKLKYFFHKNKNSVNLKDESFFENEYVFYGYIDYLNGISISYLFNKENNKYFSESFLMRGEYKIIEELDNPYKDIVYKILDISGADNPEIFFQELINSPRINKYKGCTIHQKQSKYAMVDLTSCEFDNRTDLSLYNFKP